MKRIIKRDSVQYVINQSPDVEEQEVDERREEEKRERGDEKDLSKRIDKLVLNENAKDKGDNKVQEKRKRVDKKNVKAT